MKLTNAAAAMVMVFAVTAAAAQTRKSEREHEGLRGPVHTIKYETAKMSQKAGQWVEAKRELTREVTYDKDGNFTREFIPGARPDHFGLPRNAEPNRLYGYDKKGNRFEKRSSVLVNGVPTQGDFLAQAIYTRVSRNSPPPQSSTIGGRAAVGFSMFKTVFRYDLLGNRVEEIRSAPSLEIESLFEKFVYVYDVLGELKEKLRYDETNVLTSKWSYAFDLNNNIIEQTEYKRNGSVISKHSYSYLEFDQRGNWTKRVTSREVTRKGQSFSEPKEAVYRTITYY